jgi:hypothetical protein
MHKSVFGCFKAGQDSVMSRLNRVVVAAVLAIGVMLAGGAVDAKPQPAPGRVCTKVGRVVSVPVPLVCKQTPNNGLRWRKAPTTSTTSTSTPKTAVMPSVSLSPTLITGGTFPKAVVVTSNVAGTVYFVEGAFPIKRLSDITSADVNRWASGVVYAGVATSVPIDVTAVLNGYYRAYVANADGVLSEPATNIVTISVTRASTVAVTTTTVALTCATGGTCDKGEIGPGGGVVFYVSASNFTSTGSTCNTSCRYLEAAPTDQSTGIVWATTDEMCYNTDGSNNGNCRTTSVYSGSSSVRDSSRAASEAIGMGMANTENFAGRLAGYPQNSTNFAAGIARTYVRNGKTDWHLPSKEELILLYSERVRVGGFSTGNYWSSSEHAEGSAWYQNFSSGSYPAAGKESSYFVRVVRAF